MVPLLLKFLLTKRDTHFNSTSWEIRTREKTDKFPSRSVSYPALTLIQNYPDPKLFLVSVSLSLPLRGLSELPLYLEPDGVLHTCEPRTQGAKARGPGIQSCLVKKEMTSLIFGFCYFFCFLYTPPPFFPIKSATMCSLLQHLFCGMKAGLALEYKTKPVKILKLNCHNFVLWQISIANLHLDFTAMTHCHDNPWLHHDLSQVSTGVLFKGKHIYMKQFIFHLVSKKPSRLSLPSESLIGEAIFSFSLCSL